MNHTRVHLPFGVVIGNTLRMTLIAGPCQLEDLDTALRIAETLQHISRVYRIGVVFKGSFDKANRTSGDSARGVGMDEGLEILHQVYDQMGMPVTTDVHEEYQVRPVAEVVDLIQIPALLARQTDLIRAAGATGVPVNIKKGPAMAPGQMEGALDKLGGARGQGIITERGTAFGHNDVVVDMRGLQVMREYAPVIFDASHTVQYPGIMGRKSGGDRTLTPNLARAAVGAGVAGVFVECHPNPDQAPSDGPSMTRLDDMDALVQQLVYIDRVVKPFL